jgi:hypothetical protein
MHLKWFLVGLAFLAVQMTATLASTKRKKNEEESKENSINYGFGDSLSSSPASSSRSAQLFNTMLHDATLPVFLVMGIASLASSLTSNSKNEAASANGLSSRTKREAPSNRWTSNILKVLGNVQKAIEKYQHLEGEIINDLDESVEREFHNKEAA